MPPTDLTRASGSEEITKTIESAVCRNINRTHQCSRTIQRKNIPAGLVPRPHLHRIENTVHSIQRALEYPTKGTGGFSLSVVLCTISLNKGWDGSTAGVP